MGIDLSLLPVDHFDPLTKWGFSHTVINLLRNSILFDEICQAGPVSLPNGHNISSLKGARITDGYHEGERTYGTLTKDAYGDPYTWMKASVLMSVFDRYPDAGPAATVAYIRALPPETWVILEWH